MHITEQSFPPPQHTLRSNCPEDHRRIEQFSTIQATEATALAHRIRHRLQHPQVGTKGELETAFNDLADDWRARLRRDPRRPGPVPRRERSECLHWLTGTPNHYALGALGHVRAGAEWSPSRGAYLGGDATPASRILEHYGAQAQHRLDTAAADMLINTVTIEPNAAYPDGGVAEGTRLLRGAAAERAATVLTEKLTLRGVDHVERAPVYIETKANFVLLHSAMYELADLIERRDTYSAQEITAGLARAAYHLYQGLARRRGQDDCNRVFLVALGALLMSAPPILPHDLGLMAHVLPQDRFLAEMTAALARPGMTGRAEARPS